MKQLLFAFLIMGSSSLFAQSIEFAETTIDYGEIKEGAEGIREFTFKNNGTEALIINKAVGSCGCTVPTYPQAPIGPGQSAKISVKYDTKRLGTFSKQIKIYSNATNANPIKLKIKGQVIE